MNVVVIPDKFKGTLTAREAAEAIERGWRSVRPSDQLELIPMSDGGDGFGETMALQAGGVRRRAKTVNAAGESIWAPWWWLPKSRTAVVETARVIGLALLPPGKHHPFDLDSLGLGVLLQKVFAAGPKSCLIGLGGSATNDGGMGMARALGWRFLDSKNQALERWTELGSLRRVEGPGRAVTLPEIVVAVDVENRLLGKRGAARVYGPQKGLREQDFPLTDECFRALAQATGRCLGRDDSRRAGAGAAGGLGFGCFAFLGGQAQSGFDLFAARANLDRRLGRADLVITGEGSIDRSSLMGKGVGRVAQWCREHETPCLGLGGRVKATAKLQQWFDKLYSTIESGRDPALAIDRPRARLCQIARLAALEW